MKYAIVGGIGYFINAVLLEIIFHITGVEFLAWVLSAEAAIVSNFILHNFWTFRYRRILGFSKWLSGLAKFNLTSLGAIAIEGIFGPILIILLGENYRQPILVFLIILVIVPYNWFIYNHVIWKNVSHN
jgi:dolichol-phosphate mannosyltransferase